MILPRFAVRARSISEASASRGFTVSNVAHDLFLFNGRASLSHSRNAAVDVGTEELSWRVLLGFRRAQAIAMGLHPTIGPS